MNTQTIETENFWNQKQVLVTGAGGFIGSHLVEQLAGRGARVRAFVRYNSRGDVGLLRMLPQETLAKLQIISGDLRDGQAIQDAVDGCEYVFHLGALISIPYSYLHTYEVAETNFMGTLNVLTACRRSKTVRLVHTSTSEVYGTARYAPIDEAHPLQGQSPYSASKIGADKLAESFYCAYELPVVTVRPFNTYGPRQSARAVIPVIITQALTSDVVRVGNLDTSRDFTYVTDTVDGFLCAARAQNMNGKTVNLGTGSEIKIGYLIQKIIAMIGSQARVKVETRRLRPKDSEVYRLISDNRLASEIMGWYPRTDLDCGLEKTIQWIKKHLELYRVGTYEL
ncbi:MAG TPA: GDP-mannose 4,6-dehydratase [Anaerolineales bacterium]|nr:GDP-mannose 4,6-dehydratase [Anaerolineales bacterium]